MITEIIKRDGRIEKFDMEKIEIAINKACNDGMIELKIEKVSLKMFKKWLIILIWKECLLNIFINL